MLPEIQGELIHNGLVLHRTTGGLYAYQIEKIIGNKVFLDHHKNTAFKIARVHLPNPHVLAHTGVMPAETPNELSINNKDTPLFSKTKNMKTLSELLKFLSNTKYKPLFVPFKKKKPKKSQTGGDDTDNDGDGSDSTNDGLSYDANGSFRESKIEFLKKKLEELTKRKVIIK